jgi:hypothetical protein
MNGFPNSLGTVLKLLIKITQLSPSLWAYGNNMYSTAMDRYHWVGGRNLTQHKIEEIIGDGDGDGEEEEEKRRRLRRHRRPN